MHLVVPLGSLEPVVMAVWEWGVACGGMLVPPAQAGSDRALSSLVSKSSAIQGCARVWGGCQLAAGAQAFLSLTWPRLSEPWFPGLPLPSRAPCLPTFRHACPVCLCRSFW